jgi:predicted N-acetyltransferase YhbS
VYATTGFVQPPGLCASDLVVACVHKLLSLPAQGCFNSSRVFVLAVGFSAMSLPPALDSSPVPVSDPEAFPSRAVTTRDLAAIEALHDAVFGPGALTRTAYRVREAQPRFTLHCRVLFDAETLVAAIRFTAVRIGGVDGALMLGPLGVASAYANQGHGRRLIVEGLASARAAGIAGVLLVGDPPYYARFGFARVPSGRIEMPGPVDPARLLLAEFVPGGADHLKGRVSGAA